MDIYLASSKGKANDGKFNIRGVHTWEEVMEKASQAEEVYQDKAKGKKGIFRRSWRKVGDAGPAINPWLELLPDGDYSSILCGGLKLVFGVRWISVNE